MPAKIFNIIMKATSLLLCACFCFTACTRKRSNGGAVVSAISVSDWYSTDYSKVSASNLLGGRTVLRFDKQEGEDDVAVYAQAGYPLGYATYLTIEVSAPEGAAVCAKVGVKLCKQFDNTQYIYADGTILAVDEKQQYSVGLAEYMREGYGVLAMIEIYPSYGTIEGSGTMYIEKCTLSEYSTGTTIVNAEIRKAAEEIDSASQNDGLSDDSLSGGDSSYASSNNSSSSSSNNSSNNSSSSSSNNSSSSSSNNSSSSSSNNSSSNSSSGSGASGSGGQGEEPEQIDYLWQKYKNYFPIGYAIGADHINWYKGNLDKHFNSFTCENEMKMYSIAPYSLTDDYFSTSDNMIAYAISQGKRVRGHALIWYQGAPSWIANCRDKQTLLNYIREYVTRVVKHYGDKVYCWDVVNEAIGDNNQYRSTFYDVAGIDFIKTAFQAAHDANPNIKLYYNDYNMDKMGKRAKVIEMIRELQRSGVPIDGVGMQGHYNLKDTSVSNVEAAIYDFASLGLDVQITELDIKNYGNANDQGQAELYGQLFELFRRYKNVIKGVTFWNVADDYSWLDGNQFSYYGTGDAYATIFDKNHNKKSAYYKIFNF